MRTRALPPTEESKLLSICNIREKIAVKISMETGLRVSDILRLKRRDIAEEMTIMEQKTGKTRKVTLSKDTVTLALRYGKSHGKERLIPCTRSTLYRNIKNVSKSLGYDNISMHSFRKGFARKYCKANGLYKTQRELQHNYQSTTLGYLIDDMESFINDKI